MSARQLDKADAGERGSQQAKLRLGMNMEDVDWLAWLRASEAGAILQEHLACMQLRNDAQSYEGAAEDCCTWRRTFVKILNNALVRECRIFCQSERVERMLPRYIATSTCLARRCCCPTCLFRALTRTHKATRKISFERHVSGIPDRPRPS